MNSQPKQGSPCWISGGFAEPDKAEAFYGAMFGWTFEDHDDAPGGYRLIKIGGQTVGGLGPNMLSGTPNHWLMYLAVDDAAETVKKVVEAGGSVMQEPMDAGDLGKTAVVVEPAGGVFGLWQSGSMQGFEVQHTVGSAHWYDELSKDYLETLAFFHEVLGIEAQSISSTDTFRYSTLNVDEVPVAGVMDVEGMLPDTMSSYWQIYIGVEDVDAAFAKAISLGAKDLISPQDTGFGKNASVVDPFGALMSITSLPKDV